MRLRSDLSCLLVLSIALAAVGCGAIAEPPERPFGTESDLSAGSKDCSNVPTPMCAAGTKLADKDGDGCIESCEPVACPPIAPPLCDEGYEIADTNGDGCALECKPIEPVACPPFFPTCGPGEKVADVDGDGCALECAPE
jgi:hypothetical protein